MKYTSLIRSITSLMVLSYGTASFAGTSATQYILETSDLVDLQYTLQDYGIPIVKLTVNYPSVVVKLTSSQLSMLQSFFTDLRVTEDVVLTANATTTTNGTKPPPVQPPQQIPWGNDAIQSGLANAYSKGTNVKVCIMDTGIEATHPDLAANVIGGRNFVVSGKRKTADPNAWADDNGHGTHVAGIVAAADNTIGTIGVAPEAKLYAVKVLDKMARGQLSDITDGVYECINSGAQVINMSFGIKADPTIQTPFKDAVDLAKNTYNIPVVVSAGDNTSTIANYIPAGFSNVIAVAAMNSSYQIPSWSNSGLNPNDFTGPGVGIYSTYLNAGYATLDGTSMAAPFVTGVIALVKASPNLILGLIARLITFNTYREGSGLIQAYGTILNHY